MATSPYNSSYVSWGAIFAGSVLAGAFSLVLLQFGSAVGITADRFNDGITIITPERVFGTLFWVLWIQVLASMMGGYITGRLRQPLEIASSHESEVRDGAHGLMTWATSTVVIFALAGITGAIAAFAPDAVEPVIRKTPEMLANEKAITIIAAFAAGATSLVSGVAAWWAATKGGDHRDKNEDFSYWLSFRQ